jgi:Arabinogalactan endo-1,4-beta-galactosidase
MDVPRGFANRVTRPTSAGLLRLSLVGVLFVASLPAGVLASGGGTPATDGSLPVGPLSAGGQLAVNWALTGTATADSFPGNASNAISGDASNPWCADWSPWPSHLTVDLGRTQQLDGVGITVDNASNGTPTSARASISLATQAGQWQPVSVAQSIALDAGSPIYIPLRSGFTVPARYAQLTVYSSGANPVCIGQFRLFGHVPANMALGHDVSFTSNELAAGNKFTDNGLSRNPISILASHGANWARLRLWVNPPAGYSDLNTDLSIARMIRAAGMKLYLDIHYSDFWADPGKQCIPAGWPTTLSGLTSQVQSYTRNVIAAFAAQGTPVDMVSIGNEVTEGMLWSYDSASAGDWQNFTCANSASSVGGLHWSTDTSATGWDSFTQLLKAGVAGAKAGNPGHHSLQIVIHTDLGGGLTPFGHDDTARSQYFYSQIQAAGVPFDVIGVSYYPIYQGSLSGMRKTVNNLATLFNKPIVLGETQYPWTLADGNNLGNSVWQQSQLVNGYPDSAGGQLSMANDELSILAAVPNGLGMGDFYWEPEWIPGVPWAPGASGGPTTNQTLFDFQGRTLPSIGIYQDPVKVCMAYSPLSVPCVIGR